jgi:hypothetical protein
VTWVGISCGPVYFLAPAAGLSAAATALVAAIPALSVPAVLRKPRLELISPPIGCCETGQAQAPNPAKACSHLRNWREQALAQYTRRIEFARW